MLFLLMIVLPFVELTLLLEVGERIGVAWTLFSVIATGMIGAQLARREGLKTMMGLQKELQVGVMPGRLLVSGAVIFAIGILLMTPAIITDIVGFIGLVPLTRGLLVERAFRWVERAVKSGRFVVHQSGVHGTYGHRSDQGFGNVRANETVIIDQPFESPSANDKNDQSRAE